MENWFLIINLKFFRSVFKKMKNKIDSPDYGYTRTSFLENKNKLKPHKDAKKLI